MRRWIRFRDAFLALFYLLTINTPFTFCDLAWYLAGALARMLGGVLSLDLDFLGFEPWTFRFLGGNVGQMVGSLPGALHCLSFWFLSFFWERIPTQYTRGDDVSQASWYVSM